MATAVFSHWVLDALVHRPELPLLGETSFKVGIGGWGHLPAALALESVLVLGGLGAFLPASPLSRGQAWALAVLVLLLTAFTVVGMTLAPPPPSARAMAGSSWVTLAIVCAWIGWIARPSPGLKG